MSDTENPRAGISRRAMLMGTAGVAGAALLPFAPTWVSAADQPPIGTWPAGSQGDTVNIGVAVPRTGTYAEQGEDELKGWQLAVEHINTGHDLMKPWGISWLWVAAVLGPVIGVRTLLNPSPRDHQEPTPKPDPLAGL